MERNKVLLVHFPTADFPSPTWSPVAITHAATARPGGGLRNHSPHLFIPSAPLRNYLFPTGQGPPWGHFSVARERHLYSLTTPRGLAEGRLLPTSVSWTAEELHKHKEEILIKFGLVKSIPDNPHNTKTNSILLLVIQKKGRSHLSFVY